MMRGARIARSMVRVMGRHAPSAAWRPIMTGLRLGAQRGKGSRPKSRPPSLCEQAGPFEEQPLRNAMKRPADFTQQ